MNLFRIVPELRSKKIIARHALMIARSCEAAVWDRVKRRTLEMSSSEARGYIHARALSVIQRQADSVLRNERALKPKHLSELIAQSRERTIQLVWEIVLAHRPSNPSLRRAA